MFGIRRKNKEDDNLWKLEYIDSIYKVYDWDRNLTGYFFPNYDVNIDNYYSDKSLTDHEIEDKIIEQMNKEKKSVKGGNLMLPMIKLQLLDNTEGMHLDYVISKLEENAQRTRIWKQWIEDNYQEFKIIGSSIYTAREDRNILSIVLGIDSEMILGENELCNDLRPLLNRLHQGELI
ncbi:hypothetical protein [Candidatus Nitrosocosmicus franklandus]|uniref:Uncharacterized protein n=1 Tax=Candidatus Nitrosocosmicus franklandianus TaxID=1798806 RepID=A0A484IDS2_9ARCH|nr:hypothetical protein [Candidatus Nitrosocosmicus franklandus]VFJ13820.1 conserved protein of unknown function [Candidatus Nitrosocosmicus franklandus]